MMNILKDKPNKQDRRQIIEALQQLIHQIERKTVDQASKSSSLISKPENIDKAEFY